MRVKLVYQTGLLLSIVILLCVGWVWVWTRPAKPAASEVSLAGGINISTNVSEQDAIIRVLPDASNNKVVKNGHGLSGKLLKPWNDETLTDIEFSPYPILPLKSYLRELLDAVKRNDGKAALHLYRAHRLCSSAPKNLEELSERLLAVSTADSGSASSPDLLISQYNYCDGFAAVQLPNELYRIAYLGIIAANQGIVEAKLSYPDYFPYALDDEQDYIRYSQELTEFKKEAIRHFEDAQSMGAELALLRLGDAYSEGLLVPRSLDEAYAYFYAYQLVTGDQQLTTLLERMAEGMSLQKVSSLQEKGILYANCCKN